MAEPIEITKQLKKHFGDWPTIKYIGTYKGRPVYKVSPLTEYELSNSFNGGPSLVVVNTEDFSQSTMHAWNDWSFQVTPDPDVSDND